MNADDLVHVPKIDRDAASRRIYVSFERSAGAIRDDRNAVLRADMRDLLHVSRFLGKHDRIRRLVRYPADSVGMLFAHGLRSDDAIAKARFKFGDRFGDGVAPGPF